MNYGKYIIIEIGLIEQAIIFDSFMLHDSFLSIFSKDRIISAGFFIVEAQPSENDEKDISVSVFGQSDSLKIKSREGKDETLIKRVLRKV